MIDFIGINNFKSSLNVEIKPRKLTILSGLNAAGKSSILQSISVIKQNLNGNGRPTRIHFNGTYISLGSAKHLLSRNAADETITFTFGNNGDRNIWSINTSNENTDSGRCKLLNTGSFFSKFNRSTIQYLTADRMVPKFYYERSEPKSGNYLGPRGENTPAFLAQHANDKLSPKRWPYFDSAGVEKGLLKRIAPTRRLLDGVAAWLQYLCPGTSVKAAISEIDEIVSLQYSSYTSDPLSIPSDVKPPNIGFGLTCVLPIIVACLSAPKYSLLLLENPEAHLHPKGQLALGYLAAQCSQDGVQIIAETHSDHFLNGVRLAVREKVTNCDDVALCHFARDLKTGNSYVQHPSIRKDGSLEDWPDGFFDEWEKALERLVF